MNQQGGAAYGNPAQEDPTGSVYRAVCPEELGNKYNNYLMVYLLVSKELIRKKDDSLFKINHNTL